MYTRTYQLVQRNLGRKNYELTDHLGNVNVSILDKKTGTGDGNPGEYAYLSANLSSFTDYYPFGMPMPGRNGNIEKYRFGFNGQEQDNEVYGKGNLNSAEFWMYDTRLARRWNLDPKPNPSYSQYSTFANNPIRYADPFGDTTVILDKTGFKIGSIFDNLPNEIHFIDEDYSKLSPENQLYYQLHLSPKYSEKWRSQSSAYIGQNSIASLEKIVDKSANMQVTNWISSGVELGFYPEISRTREIIFKELPLPKDLVPNMQGKDKWNDTRYPISVALNEFTARGGDKSKLFGLGHTHTSEFYKALDLGGGGPIKNRSKSDIFKHYKNPSPPDGDSKGDYHNPIGDTPLFIGFPGGMTIFNAKSREQQSFTNDWFKKK